MHVPNQKERRRRHGSKRGMSREPFPTPPPRPPRTKLKPERLDSERFLRYLLAIVVAVWALLFVVMFASLYMT